MRLPAIAVFAAAVLASGPARADAGFAGFGEYRFGMTADEARAVDASLQQFDGGADLVTLHGAGPVMFGRFGLRPSLGFRNGRLNRIHFTAGESVRSAADCAFVLESVVASLEQTYGPLAGPPGRGEYGAPLPTRATAGGSQIRFYEFDGEQNGHANWRNGGWIEAQSHYGADLRAPAGTLTCEIDVDMRNRVEPTSVSLAPPTPAQLEAARPIAAPDWRETPDSDDFEMTMPNYKQRLGADVDVALDCLVIAEGALNCAVVEEHPPGRFFGEFARRLSRTFRIAERADGAPTLGRRVRVPVRVTLTGAGAAPPQPPQEAVDVETLRALAALAPSRAALDAAELIERPQWIERPDAQDFARYYPTQALLRNLSGRVVLECLVRTDGRLLCAATEEEPADGQFGLAALGIAQRFRIAPQIDGEPTVGKRVRVPIRFTVG